MNKFTSFVVIAAVFISGLASSLADSEPSSEFDENTIRSIQSSIQPPQEWADLLSDFETSNDPPVKAAKWEQVVSAFSGGMLSSVWPEPPGGWKLVEFPTTGNLALQEVRDQAWKKAEYTKLVAQNETEAARLRGAGALMLSAASDGKQWGEKLILDIVQRPDGNVKWLTYWYARDFGQDANGIAWPVDWPAWQSAYDQSNALGKAIILRNITMLALRSGQFETSRAINLAALSGTDRELKAIALAYGHPDLGSEVTAKWDQIAEDASDPQLQALAQEAREKFQIGE